MEAKHTPGPWSLGKAHETAQNHAVCKGARVLARVVGSGYPIGIGASPESEANARLIAAAPDLLEAAREAIEDISDGDLYLASKRLYDAITKAEGRTI